MNVLSVFFVALLVYIKLRNLQQAYSTQKYRYKLYALRDTLRDKVSNKKIDPDNLGFQYLDLIICKSIHLLPKLNLVTLLIGSKILKKHGDDTQKDFKELDDKITLDEHLAAIKKDFDSLLIKYTIHKHFYMIALFKLSIVFAGIGLVKYLKNKLRARIEDSIASVRFYPVRSSHIHSFLTPQIDN